MFVHLVLVVLCICTKILYTSNIAKDLLLGCGLSLLCVVLVVHLVLVVPQYVCVHTEVYV